MSSEHRKSRLDMYLGLLVLILVSKATAQGSKGYFNQSSVAYLASPWSLLQTTSFSFRTCSRNGEIFYQPGSAGTFIELRLTNGSLQFQFRVNNVTSSLLIGSNLADNKWYNVEMNFIIGECKLKILRLRTVLYSKVLANLTHNQALLDEHFSGGRQLIVGRTFLGCINEGTAISFTSNTVRATDVLWNECPLEEQADCTTVDTNDCWNNPCENNGACIDEFQSYRCECPTLYNGTNCGNYIGNLGCAISPCANDATCLGRTPGPGNTLPFLCECLPGFTGVLCDTNMDECEAESVTCLNDGVCVDGINKYTCNCSDTGYEGPRCNTDIDECPNFNCGVGATCQNVPGSFNCVCPEGYFGAPCERVSVCNHNSGPCLNDGVCKDQGSSYKCSCLMGYTGVNCETSIDNCVNVTCTGEHVVCENGLTTYRCTCEPGYIGSPGNCTDFDECALQRCQNGATCRNLINAYKCDCVTGFNGTNCEITYNNCASDPCLNGGSCFDGLGDFTCDCSPGFTDKDCSNNIDECNVAPYPCYNGGSCVDQINGFTCDCPPGFTGYMCDTDIDECEASPCLNGATCTNLINSYTCSCPIGFTDKNCSVDIDDCLPNPCENSGQCYDGVNNFTCNCTQEWMGTTCAQEYDACSFAPCKNGATCSSSPRVRSHTCSCLSGYTGGNCETNIDDCVGVDCGPFQVCFDELNAHSCACPTGFSGVNCSVNIDECSTFPCKNNATCNDGLGTYTCNCQVSSVNLTRFMVGQTHVFQTGYNGTDCETDINECEISPPVCLHSGSCRNSNGSYTCYCGNQQIPGSPEREYYTGTNCELTTNYCQVADVARSDPPACHNNGTCKGGSGKFTCHCAPGFNGTRCKHNIDECELVRRTEGHEPCDYNGTCIDGVNSFTCECIPGITGPNCTVNIDDCKSGPCGNGGRCVDGINDYTCNCQDTGFTGENCTSNIDDCENNPCLNGAECLDGIKDYNCSCFSGYSGKNCDVDIQECVALPCQHDGQCFERSKERYYPSNPIPGNFSYETAGGYFCICPPGYNGSSCEFDIDECLSTTVPCFNGGTCKDAVNSFTCACATGFHGDRCEMEINECLLLQPCQNGATCHDRIADYECECLPSLNRIVYGGKNCSTELTGCSVNQCENGALCLPRLEDEVLSSHRYSCDCLPGWSGDLCSVDTSASFTGNSYLYQQGAVNNVSVRISTTVSHGVLTIIGTVPDNFVSLELVNGKACVWKVGPLFQSQCLPTADLNDGAYHDLFLQLSDSEVSLTSRDDQRVAVQISNKPDDVTFGGAGMFGDLINYTMSKETFIGCSQDMKINSNPVLLRDVLPSQMSGVNTGCTRTQQCFPTTCESRGVCLDKWFSAECQCDRPYYGDSCEHEIPPVTFSPSTTVSSVKFQLTEVSKEDLDLSFFFTTQNQNGVLFYMGGESDVPVTPSCDQKCNFVQLYVKSGMICLKYRVCNSGEIEECSPQGLAFNDGQQHFIQFYRKVTELSFLVDGIKMFGTTTLIPAGVLCDLYSDFVFFGNLPNVVSQRKRRQIGNPGTHFKGVIQDVRMNGNLVLFYPLSNPASNLPSAYPAPTEVNGIAEGIINDAVCSNTSPCQNNATCMDIDYNDYNCSCPEGFSGKDCDLEDVCRQSPCPRNSTCHNVRGGYECVSAGTFNGGSNSPQYQAKVGRDTDLNSISLRFRTRQQSGILLSVQSQPGEATYFRVELTNGHVQAAYNLGSGPRNIITQLPKYSDGEWHTVKVQQYNSSVFLKVDNVPKLLEDNSVQTLSSLVKQSPDLNVGAFDGCLNEVRIGNILLPFYSDNDLQISVNNNASERFTLVSQGDITLGCKSADVCVSITSPVCQNAGTCIDLWNKFECNCSLGWEGDRCQDNVDDCVNNECLNGATCEDLLNDYNCTCVPGYYGYRCEAETNECQSFPCLHEGLCTDLVNDFSCNCTANYTGDTCEIKITETCDREPCKNGATCQDYNETISGEEVARFNCSCAPGYEGRVCDKEIDYCKLADYPCQSGSTCVSNVTILDYICECVPGYTDKNCSTDIDECESRPCVNGATCHDLINGYNCSCASGWQGDNCEVDIEECSQLVNPCGDRGRCMELPGSFQCDCDQGFEGKPCEDINECEIGQCKNGASCENTIGDYICNCTLGYDGKDCDMGNCSYGQCLENSSCSVHPDSNRWSCECLPYFDGDRCEIVGPCVSGPCRNGATCGQNITAMSYTCECAPGFEGNNCEEDKDECLDSPCLNNGTCNNTFGSYNCSCDLGFTGRNCESNIDDCAEKPCQNGGICADLVNGFNCDCLETGYEGPTCSEDTDECESYAPCQHGTCVNKPGDFACDCSEGYGGLLCEIAESRGTDPTTIGIIIGSVVGFLVLVAIVCLIIFIVLARNKRATRGTYSPSRQEMSGSRVELGHVIKPPPEERLI